MRPLRWCSRIACSVFFVYLAVSPLTPAQSSTPLGQPHRITFDVMASDKAGVPVRGLTQEDFTVLDSGQPARVTSFRAVESAAHPDDVKVLLVVDMMNNPATDVMRQREQIKDFLSRNNGRLACATGIAVISETGIKMLSRYYTNSQPLLAGLDQLKTEIRPIGRSAGYFGATERMQQSLNMLGQLTYALSQQPGRKMVLFLSPGWGLFPNTGANADNRERASVFHALVTITNALREGHISLYSLDPALLKNRDPFFYKSYMKPVKTVDQAEYAVLSQQVLAENSGGLALVSDNDIEGQLRTAMRDADAWYEITLEEVPADRPNEYHDLRINTSKPGITIRTSAGYYAGPNVLNTGAQSASKKK